MAVAQCSLKQKKDFVFLKVVYDDYAEPTDSVITREHHFELPFKCNYSRKDNQNLDVLPERRLLPSLFSKKGISHQNLNFQRHIKLPATRFPLLVLIRSDSRHIFLTFETMVVICTRKTANKYNIILQ